MRELTTSMLPFQSIAPGAYGAGTQEGASVDRTGFDEAMVLLGSGVTAATGTLDVKVQESDDDATWSDVPSAAFTQITPANDGQLYIGQLRLIGRKKFIRAHGTTATAQSAYGVWLFLGQPISLPASTPAWSA
jgi:hypothetical protein